MFVALAVATHWARLVFRISGLEILDGLLMLACAVGFLVIVLWQVFREGPVTAHRIQGAVAGYLLISVIFAIAYSLIEILQPRSFQMSPLLSEYVRDLMAGCFIISVSSPSPPRDTGTSPP